MTRNNKVKVGQRLVAALLAALLLAATGTARDKSGARGLRCEVIIGATKKIVVTNNLKRIIARGTKVSFDGKDAPARSITMRSDLEPGETAVLYLGPFPGAGCRCQLTSIQ